MASKSFRRLVDDDGQEYYFSCDKFNKAISTYQSKMQTQNNRKVTKTSIRKYLADKLNVSPDTIQNWVQNKNGPSSLEDTKKLAKLIQIDYPELLDAAGEYDQPSPTKEQDKKLVEEVFKKSLAAIVKKINFVPEDTGISKPVQHINNKERAIRELRDIHLHINCHALSTSETIRNSLHRILLETEELIHGSPESWERYELDSTTFVQRYYGCERKQVLGDDDIAARVYIFDEIEFADDLGLDDVKDIDDEFDEIDLSNLEDFETYGYHGILDVNPTMVFEHMLTKYLSSVYKIVFEDLF